MPEVTKLTKNDLLVFRTESEEAIMLIKQYAPQYRSKEHYEHLGASCVMSATQTVNAIIRSTAYLEGKFVMPDEIHVERLVEWFVNNRDYECEHSILTFFIAHYIKKNINALYCSINKGESSFWFSIASYGLGIKELERQIKKRQKKGVKIIRQ